MFDDIRYYLTTASGERLSTPLSYSEAELLQTQFRGSEIEPETEDEYWSH